MRQLLSLLDKKVTYLLGLWVDRKKKHCFYCGEHVKGRLCIPFTSGEVIYFHCNCNPEEKYWYTWERGLFVQPVSSSPTDAISRRDTDINLEFHELHEKEKMSKV